MSSTFSSWAREISRTDTRGGRVSCRSATRDLLVGRDRDDLLREHVERVPRDLRLLDLARRASRARRPPTRAGRRGTSGRCGPSRRRRARGLRGRCAAARARRTSATRPGSRGRPRPCRSRARATDVATRHGIRPAFRSSSTSIRCSRASEPWCARAISRSASSFSRSASRSARRRLLTKTIVERCACTSASSSGYIDGQIEPRAPARSRRTPSRRSRPGGRAPRSSRARAGPRPGRRPQVELLARPGIDELDRAAARDEAADLLDRTLRCGEPDALRAARRAARAARATAPDARRASSRRPRAPRRRSRVSTPRSVSRAAEVSIR